MQELEGEAPPDLEIVTPSAASIEQVAAVHSRDYIAKVEQMSCRGGGNLDPDTVVSPWSYQSALVGAGSAIMAVDEVISGASSSAFALPRPPGHHSGPRYGMGFCLFNNAVIAIRHAQRAYGLKRIMLVDYDVHHGNGSQDTLYSDPSVLYFSVHQFPFYPGTGDIDETGDGEGRGYTMNVPLPAGSGDRAYASVFREVVAPAARRFRPELIVASAGFDQHWMDPLAGMRASIAGFFDIAALLRDLAGELCDGRLVGVLEGGYDLRVLAASVVGTMVIWAGGEVEDPLGPPVREYREPDVSSIIQRVRKMHSLL